MTADIDTKYPLIFSQCTIDSFYFLIQWTQKKNYNSQPELKKTILETNVKSFFHIPAKKITIIGILCTILSDAHAMSQ
jgi:hypothetical protein